MKTLALPFAIAGLVALLPITSSGQESDPFYDHLQYDINSDIAHKCYADSVLSVRLENFFHDVTSACLPDHDGYSAHIELQTASEKNEALDVVADSPANEYFLCDELVGGCFGAHYQ